MEKDVEIVTSTTRILANQTILVRLVPSWSAYEETFLDTKCSFTS